MKDTAYRTESDSMGEIKVPSDKYWGAQTERSHENFQIGTEKIPAELVTVFAYLKKTAALVNKELGAVDGDRADGYGCGDTHTKALQQQIDDVCNLVQPHEQ